MVNLYDFRLNMLGSSGTGIGKHTGAIQDNMDANFANRIENGIYDLYKAFDASNLYGPTKTELVDKVFVDFFSGDAINSSFRLTYKINKFQIYGFDPLLLDPYQNGVEPRDCGGKLALIDSGTNLSNIIIFTTIPPIGYKNIKIVYYKLLKYGSRLDASTFLGE